MGQTLALIWLAVALLWGIFWAVTDLAHNRRYGNWDFGRTFSRLPVGAAGSIGWPVLFPAACIDHVAKRKR